MIKVYFVCTGNICRSALAEGYLNYASSDGLFSATSGGTEPNQDLRCPDEIQSIAASRGFDLSTHKPRPLSEAEISAADLVLTATTAHRSAVLSFTPRALRRTFTLKEFARLAEAVPRDPANPFAPAEETRDRWASFVAEAAKRRSLVSGLSREELDIVDPFRSGGEVYEQAGKEIFAAVDQILRNVFR